MNYFLNRSGEHLLETYVEALEDYVFEAKQMESDLKALLITTGQNVAPPNPSKSDLSYYIATPPSSCVLP
jgi:hypothetical protein